MIIIKRLFLLHSAFLLISCNAQKLSPPNGLLCELLRYPDKAAITDSQPEFSWIVPTGIEKQNAFRILVSSSKELIDEDNSDYWDSGKIESSHSISVSYNGKALSSHMTYFWKVKIWDSANNESQYSEPQQFFTSELDNESAEWPGKSNYVKLPDSSWVSENRQISTFYKISPKKLTRVNEKRWFADFGKAAFATLELEIDAKNFDSISVFLGERKNEDFSVNKIPGHSNIGFEKFMLGLNKGVHKYQIKIPTHHSNSPNHQKLAPFYPEVLPFRYVEIASNKIIDINEIKQLSLFYPFDDNSSNFESSDSNLNKVWNLCKYTLKATPFLGVYADGNRERMPYEADAFIQQLGHYSVDREYSIARYTANYLIYNPSWPTEWLMHSVFMAWEDYMYTGDKEVLENNYEQLKNKTLFTLEREDGLISTTTGKVTNEFLASINFPNGNISDIIDWPKGTPIGAEQARNAGPTPEGERDGYIFTDINTVVNSFHYQSLVLMAKVAEVLGKSDDIKFFKSKSEKVQNSIQKKLFNYKKGIFIDGEDTEHSSLHANMFPLAFNLVPKENIQTVIDFIKSKGMACSVYGAQYLLDALFNAGESDYAISLMNSEDKRSWINMINVGSTMTTEAWDEYYKPNLTWNHAWGSAPANIIVRRLIGVEPIMAGFEKFRIVPQPGSLTKLKLKTPSIRGTITCNLRVSNNIWEMEITVPGNTKAELYLPSYFSDVIINDKKAELERSEYFAEDSRNVFTLKSGIYKVHAN